MFRRISLFALLVFLLGNRASSQPADLILHNAKVVTVDGQFSVQQALAVRGDRIAAVGSNEEVLRLRGNGTQVIDAKGKTVLPGLMDSHTHAAGASLYEFDHPVPEMKSIADVLDYFRERAKVVPDGEWITLEQVFITRLDEQRYPTREELDRAAPKHPVVFRTGPDAAVNSLALKASGIDKDFHISDGQPGLIERDPGSGEPTGVLRAAARLIKAKPTKKKPAFEQRQEQLKKLLADYNSVGITSIADRDTAADELEVYRALHDKKQLTTRVFVNYSVNAQSPLDEIEATIQRAAADPLHTENDWLWVRGIKVFLDGGMLTGSAYMLAPWGESKVYSITDPEYRGMRYIPHGRLVHIARTAMIHRLQPTAHSVGDGAVQGLLDAYAEINEQFKVAPYRPCLTHANFMTEDAIARMKKLGVVADLQPAWLEHDGATLSKHFGDERLKYFQPYKSLFEAGVIVGGGSDHMQKVGSRRSINAYNPWFGMWITLRREPAKMDRPLHPEQALTREQAIQLYTINNAYLFFSEDKRGSIEPGKLADLILIDRDILTCPVDDIPATQVERTWLGGKLVYSKQ